jgi:hypothetical protein
MRVSVSRLVMVAGGDGLWVGSASVSVKEKKGRRVKAVRNVSRCMLYDFLVKEDDGGSESQYWIQRLKDI